MMTTPPQHQPSQQQQAQQAVQQLQHLQAQLQHIESLPPVMLYDVAFKRSLKAGKVAIENVPPEEFLISREAKTIETARFVGHRVPRTLSELRSMGYKNVDDIGSDGDGDMNAERIERLGFDGDASFMNNSVGDDSQRVVWVTECYVRCDYDGDGISELRKVVRAGNQILDNEEVDCAPFVSICPIPMPHKFYGLSIADMAMESQKTKTNILRARLDNLHLQVNGRYFAVEGQVNLDDLLMSRPGGVVRVKQQGAVGRLDQGQGDSNGAAEMMAWVEEDLEQRTGWTRYSQGNDSKALNQTATGVQIITGKGDMRTDLIARNFAEGFVDLFRMMLKLTSQHQDKKTQIRLSGQWTDMDPREWRNQFDVCINVGLGIGSKDEQVHKLMALAQQQAQAMAIGVSTPANVYDLHVEIGTTMGLKNAAKFFSDPVKNPPPPGPNPEQEKMQATMQIEQAKGQIAMQIEQGKAQMQDQQHQRQLASDQHSEQLKAQLQAHEQSVQAQQNQHQNELESAREVQKAQLTAELAAQKQQHDAALESSRMEFDKWKVEYESNSKMVIAEIQTQASMKQAAIAANSANPSKLLGMSRVNETTGETEPNVEFSSLIESINSNMASMLDASDAKHQALIQVITKPKTIIRDANGKAQGIF